MATKFKGISSLPLNDLHLHKMESFKKKYKSQALLRTRLQELTTQLRELEKKPLDSFDTIQQLTNLKDAIADTQQALADAETNYELLEYLGRVGDVITPYYEQNNFTIDAEVDQPMSFDELVQEQQARNKSKITAVTPLLKNAHAKKSTARTKRSKAKATGGGMSIIAQLKKASDESVIKISPEINQHRIETKSADNATPTNTATTATATSSLGIATTGTNSNSNLRQFNNGKLHNIYLELLDPQAASKSQTEHVICSNCGTRKILYQLEGCFFCSECGESEYRLIDSEQVNPINTTSQQDSHIQNKLDQLQAKEKTVIPDEVCELVIKDLEIKGIKPSDCSIKIIRKILKNNKLNTYYDHVHQIYCKITGNKPIRIPREVEELILEMFRDTQKAFEQLKRTSRKNISLKNSSFILHKLFKLIGFPEYAEYFPLVSNTDRLRSQEHIWDKICEINGWQ